MNLCHRSNVDVNANCKIFLRHPPWHLSLLDALLLNLRIVAPLENSSSKEKGNYLMGLRQGNNMVAVESVSDVLTPGSTCEPTHSFDYKPTICQPHDLIACNSPNDANV
ncbi:hypothetical protein AVEN_5528-1 [Araneus ventricosus]|uniref:Uncharacterized protein n=1 Tax=Araneus ventricosus TaxID=182803 RepID=A0A4Y2JUQ5_ARAVE|nr:hypothetical protein AVEN_5528-1 [Araneus ventricosus]